MPSATREPSAPIRLTVVQYGDYADGYIRLRKQGGAENYYAQRYTVDFVAELATNPAIESITVLTFSADAETIELEPRLSSGGVDLYRGGKGARHAELIAAVARTRPTHLIVAAPIVPLIRYGLAHKIRVLPLFADSFQGNGLRHKVRNFRLAYVLNDQRIPFVANHNLAAAMDLARIGVRRGKVLPYDWPAIITPSTQTPKPAPPRDRPFTLVYVGQINEPKGVGDLIRGVAELKRLGLHVTASIIGNGDTVPFERLAVEHGVTDRVAFLGRRSHSDVQLAMREHDAVIVPSRHSYPEGLPMTLYEAFCSRTPLIVSDHPMFALRIRHLDNALVFSAEKPAELAARVFELAQDSALYERLSQTAEQAAQNYLCPLKWDRLIATWLGLANEDLASHTLARSRLA